MKKILTSLLSTLLFFAISAQDTDAQIQDTVETQTYSDVLVFAPNAFTPNGDEFNNAWKIFVTGVDVYSVEIFVYDRWGQIVWESHDINYPWDGTHNGTIVSDGIYTWTFRAGDALNDNIHRFQGYVNVLK